MSAEVISMEEWQQAKFIDWAGRYFEAMLSQMTPRQRAALVRRIKEDLADHGFAPLAETETGGQQS